MSFKVFALFVLWITISTVDEGSAQRSMIPPDLLKRVAKVSSTKDFITGFLHNKPGCRKGKEGCTDFDVTEARDTEIIAGMIGSPSSLSGCQPQSKLMTIKPHDDPNVINYPDCAEVPQCGGCCVLDILACTPTSMEVKSTEVILAKYPKPGADYFEFIGTTTVYHEHHFECSCQCKVTEQDCDPDRHVYLPDECRCLCRNEAEGDECNLNKRWSDDSCSCECREVVQCHSDEYFDTDTCRCDLRDNAPIDKDLIQGDQCASMRCRQGYSPIRTGLSCSCVHTNLETQQGSIMDPIVPRRQQSAQPISPRPSRRRRPNNGNTASNGPIVPRG